MCCADAYACGRGCSYHRYNADRGTFEQCQNALSQQLFEFFQKSKRGRGADRLKRYMREFISSSPLLLFRLSVFLLFALSCLGVDSSVLGYRSSSLIQILSVLPSQLYSFAPAVLSVIGLNFPRSSAVYLIPQRSSKTILPYDHNSLLPSDSHVALPCNASSGSQYLVTCSLSSQIANALQIHCNTMDTHDSKCSVDLAMFDSHSLPTSFASLEMMRMNVAIVFLLPPHFHTPSFPIISRSTCPILVSGSRFILHPGIELTCYTPRCSLQCGVHNDSTILLIPDAGCEGIGLLRVLTVFTWNATKVSEAWHELSIVSSSAPDAPVCASALLPDEAAIQKYFSTDCSDSRHLHIWNHDHLPHLSDFDFTQHVSPESESASFFNRYQFALSNMPHLVTLVVTMCNRPSLLLRMLRSFVKCVSI